MRPFAYPLALSAVCLALASCHLGDQKKSMTDEDQAQQDALQILDRIEQPTPLEVVAEIPLKYDGGLTQVTFSRVGRDTDADVSCDGKWLAFTSTRNTRQPQIYMKNLVSGNSVILKTDEATDCIHPRFSPDGTQIAYASLRNGNYDIWVMDAHKNGSRRQVTSSPFHELHPSWSADGSRLAFMGSDRRGQWHVQVIDLRNYQTTTVTPGVFPEWCPAKGSDTIAFQKARQRDVPWYGIWKVNADGGMLTEVVAEAEWAAIEPGWSPDGKWIVFTSICKSIESKQEKRTIGGDDIWMIREDGTGLQRVTTDPRPDNSPRWATDGKIYFTSFRQNYANIWSVKVPDSAPEGTVTEDSPAATTP